MHALVRGTVQGVGFRAWTQRAASQLGLTGWVRNLDDGRVEAWLEGEEADLRAMVEQLESGPETARVEDVEVRPVEPRGAPGFIVRENGASPVSR